MGIDMGSNTMTENLRMNSKNCLRETTLRLPGTQ